MRHAELNMIRLFAFALVAIISMSGVCPTLGSSARAARSTNLRTLVHPTLSPPTQPGTNGRIAFTSMRDGNSEIYTVSPDGSDQINLTNNPAQDFDPAWSPDGRHIAFVSSRGGSAGDIYVMAADGSGVRRISDRGNITDNFIKGLSWSPDGTRILYVNVFMAQIGSICIANVTAEPWNGGCIADDLLDVRDAAWSPDGKRIAFVGRNSLNVQDGIRYDLYVANADGSGRRKITDGLNFSPTWSPNGTKLVFAKDLNSPRHFDQIRSEIFVADVSGCEPLVRLTNNMANDSEPAWSPDGAKIVFASSPDAGAFNNKHEIYMMGADGGSPLKITDNSANDSSPDWQPGTSAPAANPIDNTQFFVRQHYVDFLGRCPDPVGYQGWQDILNNCAPGNTACDHIEVSSAFFRSTEFQQTGYFVYRFYSAAFGRAPRYAEFTTDMARVGGFQTEAEQEVNRAAFVQEFMSRAEFRNRYDSLATPTAYVDGLLQAVGLLNHPSRAAWIQGLTAGTLSRAQVLRALAESPEVNARFYNEAFVIMQYFGYLRRDADLLYLEWIETLNRTGDYRIMVNGFVNSQEYRQRFGQ